MGVVGVGHNGTDANGILQKLFVQERGANDLTGSVTLDSDDFPQKFTIQPVVDPRSNIEVIGDDDPEVDGDWPLFAAAVNASSAEVYGTRQLIVRESEAKNLSEIGIIALAISEQRNYDLWETRIEMTNWALEPGDKILVYLPNLGIDDRVGGGLAWVLQEVEESVRRGRAKRFGMFRETVAAASTRVS